MFRHLRWIRQRRQDRQPQVTKLREATRLIQKTTVVRETEARIWRGKKDDSLARFLFLALDELQRIMDPMLAAQVYNNCYCPLTRLPEELLLLIISFLDDDTVTLNCLRNVSRAFFRLLDNDSHIWKINSDVTPAHLRSFPGLPSQYRRLLQRDGRCKNCRRWNDEHEGISPVDDCRFLREYRYCDRPYRLYGMLYCNTCDSYHDISQFPAAQRNTFKRRKPRRCLGQTGSVRLCEHVQITWASIKNHIEDWRRQQQGGGEDWQACLDSFLIECHDSSHDARCTASEKPTRPRARLCTGEAGDLVVLAMSWSPHGRLDALDLTADGQIPAPELRALFRRFRQLGPADDFYPRGRPGALPEMSCFDPRSPLGRYIYYKTGEDDKPPPPPAPLGPMFPNSFLMWCSCRALHNLSGTGEKGRIVEIMPHYLRGSGGTGISQQCLEVSYKKSILICRTKAMLDPTIKINPTDHWLHAMDTRTYPHPMAKVVRPQCKVETCVNYHRWRKDYYLYDAFPPYHYWPYIYGY